MNYSLEPSNFSKELILKHVTEETIMEHYLGIPIKKGIFKSPLRVDKKPTCAFYKNKNGHLILKDFNGSFCGDCFNVVMKLHNCSYFNAIKIICNDFNLISSPELSQNKQLIEYTYTQLETTQTAIIQNEIKEFNDYELDWWSQYGITEKILNLFNVYSCKNVFLNYRILHVEKTNQLVFGYYGGIKQAVEQWRVYFPGNKRMKFISNWKSTQIQGSHMLQYSTSNAIVITKSLKDVMTLYGCGVTAIAPVTENCFITKLQYLKLKEQFEHIYIFYDNDYAGIVNMNKFRKQYSDLIPIFIPRKYQVKDISDFYKKYGKQQTLNIINVVLNGK